MNKFQTVVYILFAIWLVLSIINTCMQISIGIKQFRHAKKIEDAVRNFDNMLGDTFKGVKRQEFFDGIDELKATELEKDKNENEKGDK